MISRSLSLRSPGTWIFSVSIFILVHIFHIRTWITVPFSYYGKAKEDLDNYCGTFQRLHPEVDNNPMREEVDENTVVLSGHGRKHGRNRVLEKVVSPASSFTRLRATLPADTPLIPRRPKPRPSASTDVSFSHFHPLFDIRSCMAKLTRFLIFEIVGGF